MRLRTLVALIATVTSGAAAHAQFSQYTEPGSLAEEKPARKQQLETASEEARWRLGRLRLEPLFGLSNIGYVDNVFSAPDGEQKVSDYRGTAGVGLASYLHLGPDVIFSTFVLPEHVWWLDLEQLRETNVSFGAGTFGYFNRLTVELAGRRIERERPLSNELEIPVELRTDQVELGLEIDFRGPLGFFASATDYRFEHRQRAGPGLLAGIQLLDRDETIVEAGLEYTLGNGLAIGLGAQYSEATFDIDPDGRSNSGTSPLLRFGFSGNRLRVDLAAAARRLEFASTGASQDYDSVTGRALVAWSLRGGSVLSLYGSRQLVYSAARSDEIFTDQLLGASVASPLGNRSTLRVFLEDGDDRFSRSGASEVLRRDDFRSIGAGLKVLLGSRLTVNIEAVQTRFESNLPGLDRELNVLRSGINLGGSTVPW